MKTALTATLLTVSASSLMAAGHASTMGHALANDGMTLVVMSDISSPGDVMTYDLASAVQAIAYRPVTGDLLGFSNGTLFTIDPASGEMTDLEATFMDDAMVADGASVGFDFNNAIDAVRVVSTAGDNLVYFPEGFGDNDERAGSVRRFTSLAYADGDTNAGAEPMVFANAYTNAISDMTAETTFQYALDAATDSLVSLANNAGTLATIGAVTVGGDAVDLAAMGGFDILSPAEGENMGYAILQMEGSETAGLYSINLETGAAESLADLGMGGITGFAVSPGM
ncbi:MAG: DUF4394 domain-containing protein [Pelagibaca sp.]